MNCSDPMLAPLAYLWIDSGGLPEIFYPVVQVKIVILPYDIFLHAKTFLSNVSGPFHQDPGRTIYSLALIQFL